MATNSVSAIQAYLQSFYSSRKGALNSVKVDISEIDVNNRVFTDTSVKINDAYVKYNFDDIYETITNKTSANDPDSIVTKVPTNEPIVPEVPVDSTTDVPLGYMPAQLMNNVGIATDAGIKILIDNGDDTYYVQYVGTPEFATLSLRQLDALGFDTQKHLGKQVQAITTTAINNPTTKNGVTVKGKNSDGSYVIDYVGTDLTDVRISEDRLNSILGNEPEKTTETALSSPITNNGITVKSKNSDGTYMIDYVGTDLLNVKVTKARLQGAGFDIRLLG